MAAVSAMANEGWDLPEWSPDTFDLAAELRVNERLQQEDLDELAEWAARQRALPALRGALAVSLRCLTPKAQSAQSGRNSNPGSDQRRPVATLVLQRPTWSSSCTAATTTWTPPSSVSTTTTRSAPEHRRSLAEETLRLPLFGRRPKCCKLISALLTN